MSLTKQEMFNRAYRGLASQGWRTAYDEDMDTCQYQTGSGLRCAWGWVDESLSGRDYGDVSEVGKGIAVCLDKGDMLFALELQRCHDRSSNDDLQRNMDAFAARHSLSIPELP